MTSQTALSILKRIVAAFVGYIVIFSAYFALFGVLSKAALSFGKIWAVTVSTLTLPFTDALTNVHILSRLHKLVPMKGREAIVGSIVHDLRFALGTEVVLFAALVAAIYIFEKSLRKGERSIILFYAVIPALLWILWSQCYLLV